MGRYLGKVISVDERVGGLYGPELEIVVEIIDGVYAGRQLKLWVGIKASIKSNLIKYSAAFGLDTTPGKALNTDDLVGKVAVATVTIVRRDDGTEYNKITDFTKSTNPVSATAVDDWVIPDNDQEGGRS